MTRMDERCAAGHMPTAWYGVEFCARCGTTLPADGVSYKVSGQHVTVGRMRPLADNFLSTAESAREAAALVTDTKRLDWLLSHLAHYDRARIDREMAESVEFSDGRCCSQGRFGEPHDCDKQLPPDFALPA